MVHIHVCFTIYVQKAVSIHIINYVFDATGFDSIVGIGVCYGAEFGDITIALIREVTIVGTLMHGDVNNAPLGVQ